MKIDAMSISPVLIMVVMLQHSYAKLNDLQGDFDSQEQMVAAFADFFMRAARVQWSMKRHLQCCRR